MRWMLLMRWLEHKGKGVMKLWSVNFDKSIWETLFPNMARSMVEQSTASTSEKCWITFSLGKESPPNEEAIELLALNK